MALTVCEFSIICIRRVSLCIYHRALRHACFNCKCVENNGPDCSPRFAGLSAFLPLCALATPACVQERIRLHAAYLCERINIANKRMHTGVIILSAAPRTLQRTSCPHAPTLYTPCVCTLICGRTLVRKFAICDTEEIWV